MKKIIMFFFILLAIMSFSDNVILGVALSFEGITSEFSEDQLDAIELANHIFPSYKDYTITLSISDISNSVKETTLDLIDKNSISIMGYPTSSEALKAISITEKEKIPVILTTATNFLLTFGKNYVFMATPSDHKEAKTISDFITNNFENPKIAFVYNTDQLYCSGIVSRIYSNLTQRSFSFNQKNYNLCDNSLKCAKNLADLIKKYDPDIILFSSYFELSNELLKILSKYDLNTTFIFSSSFDDKDFFNSFLKRDNVYMCSLNVDKKNEALYDKVATEYKKFYSKPMDLYSFMAYESYIIFYEALKNCVDSGKPVDRKNINYYIQKIGKSERFKDAFRFKITKLSDLIISRHEGKYKEKK